jgi:hypothetical protein
MKLVYRIDGQPDEKYDFEPSRLMTAEAEAIEDLKNVKWESFEEFGQLFLKGNAKAHRAALWICKKRLDPTLKFADLVYPLGALQITFSDEEASKFIRSIRENPDLDEDQKAYLIGVLDLSVYEGEMADVTDIKELSGSSDPDSSKSVTPDSLPDSES